MSSSSLRHRNNEPAECAYTNAERMALIRNTGSEAKSCESHRRSVYHDRVLGAPMHTGVSAERIVLWRSALAVISQTAAFARGADGRPRLGEFACRACRAQTGHLVLDLGE